MRTGKKPVEHMKVHLMNEQELLAESERLEALLQSGELSIKECRRLGKIRAGLDHIEDVKYV